MTCYERIATLLQSTGVYTMDGNSLVDAEMRAYAIVLQALFDRIAELEAGIYFDNPESTYCEGYERLFGLPVTPTTLEGVDLAVRREKIEAMKLRLAIDGQSCSVAGMEEALKSYGITASFTQTATGVTVEVSGNKGYIATVAETEKMIRSLFPCGVDITITGV